MTQLPLRYKIAFVVLFIVAAGLWSTIAGSVTHSLPLYLVTVLGSMSFGFGIGWFACEWSLGTLWVRGEARELDLGEDLIFDEGITELPRDSLPRTLEASRIDTASRLIEGRLARILEKRTGILGR